MKSRTMTLLPASLFGSAASLIVATATTAVNTDWEMLLVETEDAAPTTIVQIASKGVTLTVKLAVPRDTTEDTIASAGQPMVIGGMIDLAKNQTKIDPDLLAGLSKIGFTSGTLTQLTPVRAGHLLPAFGKALDNFLSQVVENIVVKDCIPADKATVLAEYTTDILPEVIDILLDSGKNAKTG